MVKKKGFFAQQGYSRIGIKSLGVLGALVLVVIVFLVLFFTEYATQCDDGFCFVEKLQDCDASYWVRHGSQSSWAYEITGSSGRDACAVEVRLLQMNEGLIEAEKLHDLSMTCNFPKGETQFPEEDLTRCTGTLKEELQDVIIQRMHRYVLDHLDEISEEFGKI